MIVDLSADHRFDDAWYYGLPELTRDAYAGERRIANPGCYASAMQLAVAPMLDLLDGRLRLLQLEAPELHRLAAAPLDFIEHPGAQRQNSSCP